MNERATANAQLAHYRILEKIGAGGMGEVFLAEASRLKRQVALKILPVKVAANQERIRRFIQEATAVSALNHPNIITIYDIGEDDGVNFIATEYVAGVTLSQPPALPVSRFLSAPIARLFISLPPNK